CRLRSHVAALDWPAATDMAVHMASTSASGTHLLAWLLTCQPLGTTCQPRGADVAEEIIPSDGFKLGTLWIEP
ncbi:hypothetical protein Tco_0346360, partial [Tanacetum coccineum]